MSSRPPAALVLLLAIAFLASCGTERPGLPSAQSPSPPSPVTSSSAGPASPTPVALTREELQAETARALAVPPPPVQVKGDLGFPLPADGSPGIDFGGIGEAGIQAGYRGALAAVEPLYRTPALLKFSSPRSVQDFAPITAVIHPSFRAEFDRFVKAFVGSSINDPSLPVAPAASEDDLSDLQSLTALFRLVGGGQETGEGVGPTATAIAGFGGRGAGAFGDLVVTNPTANEPTNDSVLIAFGMSSLYNTIATDGSLKVTAVVFTSLQLTMKRAGSKWLVSDFGYADRDTRTVDRL